jgi:hypothetical protein
MRLSNKERLLDKADRLCNFIELGLLCKGEAFFKLRELRAEITEQFEEGSDEFMECIYPLIDANELAQEL